MLWIIAEVILVSLRYLLVWRSICIPLLAGTKAALSYLMRVKEGVSLKTEYCSVFKLWHLYNKIMAL
jgi:hypothetical protein